MRKIMALVLVAVMMMAMGVTAFADHTVSTTSTTHTYEIYQIFTGTKSGNQLTDLKYGENAVGTTGNAVSQSDMTTLNSFEDKTYANDQAKITDLLPFVDLSSTPVATIGKDNDSSASLAEGYYIIKDLDDSLEDPETYTLYLFKVLDGDLVIAPKSGTTESEKNINESTKTKVGDYDIGDVIPYELKMTLPENYTDYKKYYVKFVDDMSAGLTLNTDSVKIHYGASDTTGTSISFNTTGTSSYDGGTLLTYEIADLKTLEAAAGLTNTSVITITYTATLNSNAVIGEEGNPNKYHVTYSNNPNESGDGTPGTNDTPDDTNIVFTFETIFDKVDGSSNALTGADFTLYKKINNEWVDVTALNTGDGAINPAKGTVDTTTTEFTFSGLGQGDYKLVETTTPAGYNTIDPIEFTITAEYEIVSGSGSITSLTGTGSSITMTPNESAGTLTANIVNQSGAILPSTGGIGTTIFYVVGALLVIGAGVLLVTKRRMGAEK